MPRFRERGSMDVISTLSLRAYFWGASIAQLFTSKKFVIEIMFGHRQNFWGASIAQLFTSRKFVIEIMFGHRQK